MTTHLCGGALALALLTALGGQAEAAVVLTGDGVHANNFDTLANSGQSTGGLAGWEFLELGTSGNDSYFATNGAENSGNTFSLGQVGASDRAFGGLTHNTTGVLQPMIGVQLVNLTGKTITGFTVSYVGEQWRLGQTGRGADRMDFAYRLGAGALDTGVFTDVDALDFVAPNTTGAQIRDGNAAANRVLVNGAITGLNIAHGDVLTLRWADFDVRLGSGQAADDALGIDDFIFTPTLAAVPEPAAWAMMICGFGVAGSVLRRRRGVSAV
ncbi:PEPxxWA-CTERM sorting domain-containing protein [Phenylobacterium sp.]|uniref:PEPxxWA-CTERM sorting domain-containing protein n=1 Tax=Phenylobacterium sp. TaxID=1871053 RepID=UPI00301E0380